jgi:hypothetical protein
MTIDARYHGEIRVIMGRLVERHLRGKVTLGQLEVAQWRTLRAYEAASGEQRADAAMEQWVNQFFSRDRN